MLSSKAYTEEERQRKSMSKDFILHPHITPHTFTAHPTPSHHTPHLHITPHTFTAHPTPSHHTPHLHITPHTFTAHPIPSQHTSHLHSTPHIFTAHLISSQHTPYLRNYTLGLVQAAKALAHHVFLIKQLVLRHKDLLGRYDSYAFLRKIASERTRSENVEVRTSSKAVDMGASTYMAALTLTLSAGMNTRTTISAVIDQ